MTPKKRQNRSRKALQALLISTALIMPADLAHAQESKGMMTAVRDYLQELFGFKRKEKEADQPVEYQTDDAELFPETPIIGFIDNHLDIKVSETEGVVTLTVTRGEPGDEVVEARYNTEAKTAVPGEDFIAASGSILIPAGETSAEIKIRILNDSEYEADKTFKVILSRPINADFDTSSYQTTIRIQNDDPKPKEKRPGLLSAQPSALKFGRVLTDSPRRREAIFSNEGEMKLKLGKMAIDGGDGAFTILNDQCSNRVLAPNASCSVYVGFTAFSSGEFKASLLASPENASQVSIDVTGIGRLPKIVEDPEAARIIALRNERRLSKASIQTNIVPKAPEKPKDEFVMKDPDWAAIGIGRNYFTLPVDRERIIMQGKPIRCVLEDDIDSSLPGTVRCVVERNVYGGEGRLILIPKFSVILGSYEPLSKVGDQRLDIVWSRIIRPDGSSIKIDDGFNNKDQTGQAGAVGEMDLRIKEKFGGAALLTAITVGSALAIPTDDDRYTAAYESIADNLGEITTQLVDQNLNMSPIIRVPARTRIVVEPKYDLWMPQPDRIQAVPVRKASASGAKPQG